jgi:hypothetical protein
MRRLAFLAILIGMILSMPVLAGAQPATPEAPKSGCTVEPRDPAAIERLMQLAATPVDPEFRPSVRLPEGVPVDAETLAELRDTLDQADACAQARDVLRFLALYTDDFVVASIFGSQPAGIDAGEGPSGAAGEPGDPSEVPQNVIAEARLLDDGRIAAHVYVSTATDFGSIVWFEEVDGFWRIDDIRSAADPPRRPTELPEEAQALVDTAIEDAAAMLGVDPGSIEVVRVEAIDWPDTALGCPEEGGVYAAVITPGYRIQVTDGETTLTYHTDTGEQVIPCNLGAESDD